MTNFSEAHIDFMKTYEHYKETKTRMFYNQSSDDIAILNYDNSDVMEAIKDIKSIKKYFSKEEIDGCHLKDRDIYYGMMKKLYLLMILRLKECIM